MAMPLISGSANAAVITPPELKLGKPNHKKG